MHDFVPPYPERPSQPLSPTATLRLARRNSLAIWEDRCRRNRRVLGELLPRPPADQCADRDGEIDGGDDLPDGFGRQLGAEHAAEIVTAFSEYQRLIGQLDLAYFFGLPDWIPRFHSPAIHRSAKRIHKVLEQVIGDCRERLSSGEASMIRLLLEARDPESGEPLDDVALRNEAAVIFMAGHETTANSLAWAGICCRERPSSKNASTTNWEKCSPAACRPSTTSPSCSIRAPSSRRRCGYTPRPAPGTAGALR